MASISTSTSTSTNTTTLPLRLLPNKTYQLRHFLPISLPPSSTISGYCPVGRSLKLHPTLNLAALNLAPMPRDERLIYLVRQWMESPLRAWRGWRFVAEVELLQGEGVPSGTVLVLMEREMSRRELVRAKEARERAIEVVVREKKRAMEESENILDESDDDNSDDDIIKIATTNPSKITHWRASLSELKARLRAHWTLKQQTESIERGKGHQGEKLREPMDSEDRAAKIAEMEGYFRMPWVPACEEE